MSRLNASTYFMSSPAGFVSSNRRLHRPPNSSRMPKFRQIALTWPMCGKPFGSGGKRVAIRRPKRFVATSCATISRMKSRCAAGAGDSGAGDDTVWTEYERSATLSKDITALPRVRSNPRLPPCFLLTPMTFAEWFLPELDHEMRTTRSLLERVPFDNPAWKPHTKSTAIGELASHLTNLAGYGARVATAAKSRAAIAALPEQALGVPWSLKFGDHVIFTQPRGLVLRSFFLNHIIHHRGQLSVYLRLNDVP